MKVPDSEGVTTTGCGLCQRITATYSHGSENGSEPASFWRKAGLSFLGLEKLARWLQMKCNREGQLMAVSRQ